VECSEDGLTLEPVEDCEEDDEVCIAGACSAPPCSAGETVCMGKNIFVCNETGTDLELSGMCGEGAYCDPETGGCVVGKCTPGETICAEGGVAICKASASGFADAVPCGEGEGCLMGACALIVCEASTRFCTAGHLFLCNDTGTTFEIAQTCGLDQYCDEDTAKCAQRVCEPGAQFCGDDGNARKCNSLGNGSTVATTCADSQVCEMKGGTASCVSGEGGAGGDGG
jgi:hypothetical protein